MSSGAALGGFQTPATGCGNFGGADIRSQSGATAKPQSIVIRARWVDAWLGGVHIDVVRKSLEMAAAGGTFEWSIRHAV